MPRTVYVHHPVTGEMVEKGSFDPPVSDKRSDLSAPWHWPDLREYASPIDGRPISGRADRRADLARSGSVEPDTMQKRGARSAKYAAKYGLPLIGRDCDEWSKKRR